MRRRSPARDRGLVYIPEPASMLGEIDCSEPTCAQAARREHAATSPRFAESTSTTAGKEARVSGWSLHTGFTVSGSALLHLLLHSDTQEPTLSVRCQGNGSMRRRQRRCGASQVRSSMARRWLFRVGIGGRRSDIWGSAPTWVQNKERISS